MPPVRPAFEQMMASTVTSLVPFERTQDMPPSIAPSRTVTRSPSTKTP
jgi:hypothetical protein